jgi:hypothetical protein
VDEPNDARPRIDELVVPFRVPRRYSVRMGAFATAFVGGWAAVMAADPSWEAAAVGGLLFAGIAWVGGTMSVLSRRPKQIVLTSSSLTTPGYTIDWERVANARVTTTSASTGALPSLVIEPYASTDVRWTSRFLRLNGRVSDLFGMGALHILQPNVDRPLEALLAQMEERAGRSLASRRG